MELLSWSLVWSLVCVVVVVAWKCVVMEYFIRPWILDAKLRRQGIHGPPRSIMSGNVGEMVRMKSQAEEECIPGISHDIAGYVQPHMALWSKTYGVPFRMFWGTEPSVVLMDLNMIKEVLYNKSGAFWRPDWQTRLQTDILGRGLVVSDREEWTFKRQILNPAFHQEKIKRMVDRMADSVSDMLDKWNALTEDKNGQSVEVEAGEYMLELTADVISRTAFGSSYKMGFKVFETLNELAQVVYKKYTAFWSTSMFSVSKVNRDIKKLHSQLDSMLDEIIQARRVASSDLSSDLLGLMLAEVDANQENSNKTLRFTTESCKEECKTFYLAGYETNARALTWSLMLLAVNPEWQDRARAEVMDVCPSGAPDFETLSKLKVIGMILNESLRLYSPAPFLLRKCYRDTQLGELTIPAGVGVVIPVGYIHHDAEIWGADVNEFNPQRFAEGVASAASNPFAFLPFGQGQRICIGQSLALTESKVALTMILQKFRFDLAPGYRHSPVLRLTVMPKHGLPLLIQRL